MLDEERQNVVYPGMTRSSDRGIVRGISTEGVSGEIIYSACNEAELDTVIQQEIQAARRSGFPQPDP